MSTNFLTKNSIKRKLKSQFLWFRKYYYQGKSFTCPLCGNSFRTMLPGGFQSDAVKKLDIIGAGLRSQNICPYCLSTDRDRLVYVYLSDIFSIKEKEIHVLHVSPEPALYRVLSTLPSITYTTGTKYAEGTYYPSGIEFFDLRELPYSNNTFDMVICNHVLEHIEEDYLAMAEIFRVLKNNGLAVLQVPISEKLVDTLEDPDIKTQQDRHTVFGQFDHVRVYGQDYPSRLEQIGFSMEVIPSHRVKEQANVSVNFALNPRENLYIAHKKL
ncbi:MAG: class I SAM-dependent methyltransferase [Bacteroidetes bacterium]|nr:class I SAM-dependent methyltransferase [Bacteroidota bacterium]